MSKRTEIFGPLAEDYARYRPGYPAEVLDELIRVCGLRRDWMVSDIGSGTGNLTRLFLDAGNQVVGVEPNREMREAAERLLAGYSTFHSLEGVAEHIPLDACSIDLIAVGQALHWFDAAEARNEFLRILRPGGWVIVTWNDRLCDATAFTKDYETITQSWADAQPPLPHAAAPFQTGLDHLFGAVTPHSGSFQHTQSFDLEGLLGRARSSGFIPQPGASRYAEFTILMTDLFNRHQCDGMVEFHYITRLYLGQLG